MPLWRLSAEIAVRFLTRWTFYMFHFVWCVCVFDCVYVCLSAHGTSKVWGVKEHLQLFLPQGQGFIVRLSSWVTVNAHHIFCWTVFPYMTEWLDHTVLPVWPQCHIFYCSHTHIDTDGVIITYFVISKRYQWRCPGYGSEYQVVW